MSILYSSDEGWMISHNNFIKNVYKSVDCGDKSSSYQLKNLLFDIRTPFLRFNQNVEKYYNPTLKKKKTKCIDKRCDTFEETVEFVSKKFDKFIEVLNGEPIFDKNLPVSEKNELAKDLAAKCYLESNKTFTGFGQNGPQCTLQKIDDALYLFPNDCQFFNKNIIEIDKTLLDRTFDLILMDPPWWNKAIRRKRKNDQSYDMMYNLDLTKIPVQSLLNPEGLVVIWCTNSPQHYNDLVNTVLPIWGVEICAVWYWVKVTKNGEPICKFSTFGMKQPFEQLFICKRKDCNINVPDQRLIVSVPSAINSHKPPLLEILKEFIPEDAKCLEIFARYLLPNWTSWGLEAIRLQHISLYEEIP